MAGAERILTEYRPALVVEIEQRHLGGSATVAEVVEGLLQRGYSCRCIGRGNKLFAWDDFDLNEDQSRWLRDGEVIGRQQYTNNFVFV